MSVFVPFGSATTHLKPPSFALHGAYAAASVNSINGAGGHEERFDLRRIVLAVFDVLLGADEQDEVGDGDVYFTIAVIFETV